MWSTIAVSVARLSLIQGQRQTDNPIFQLNINGESQLSGEADHASVIRYRNPIQPLQAMALRIGDQLFQQPSAQA